MEMAPPKSKTKKTSPLPKRPGKKLVKFRDGRIVPFPERPPSTKTAAQIRANMMAKGMHKKMIDIATRGKI